MSAPDHVVGWASRTLMRVRPEGRLSRVVVRHSGANTARMPSVAEIEIDAATARAEDVADGIMRAAREDAAGFGGTQRYVVCGYFGSSAEPGPDRLIVRIHSDEDTPSSAAAFESEGPTPTGVMAQMMRQNEALVRIVVGSIPHIVGQYQALATHQAEQIRELRDRETRTRELFEDLSDRKHTRELEAREQDRIETRDKLLLQKLETVFPVVLARLGGQAAPRLTESPRAIDAMVLSFFESLDDERFQKLLAMLDPEQKILVLEVYKQLKFPGGGEPAAQGVSNGHGSGGTLS